MAELRAMSDGHLPFTVARLGQEMSQELQSHMMGPRLQRDLQNIYAFCYVDQAHTVMIAEQGIITAQQAGLILKLLKEIEALGPNFPVNPKYDSMVLQFEKYMVERIGENVAGRMHTGRSRPSHGNAINRLVTRDMLLRIIRQTMALAEVLLRRGEEHHDTAMPGYTHGQHAQPWTFGHYLMRWFYTLERDLQRLVGAFGRSNLSSLGTAALAGTSWNLNRHRVCELLGHDDIVRNSHDAGSMTADYPEEIAAVLAILMNHLGRIATDLYLWHSWEFGMVELPDALCDASDLLPQPKNPHALERVKALAGAAHGWVPGILGILRASSSIDVDVHYAGDGNLGMGQAVGQAIELMQAVLGTLRLNKERMRERCDVFWTTASHLTDVIARETGIAFRTVHHVVGRLVRLGVERGIHPRAVTTALLDEAAEQAIGRKLGMPQALISEAMDGLGFLRSRTTIGSPNPRDVLEQVQHGRKLLAGHQGWVAGREEQLRVARAKLDTEVDRYLRAL